MPALSRALKASPPETPRRTAEAPGLIASHAYADEVVWAFVGGALIADLDLRANLTLGIDCTERPTPAWLEGEIHDLFAKAGAPLGNDWLDVTPALATPLSRLATRVGRALAEEPDGLMIDAAAWDDTLIAPAIFERAYRARYPWRDLRWLDGVSA